MQSAELAQTLMRLAEHAEREPGWRTHFVGDEKTKIK
jgi:hypothetical protein